MFKFEADGKVIVEQNQVLESALSTNPKTQAALRAQIRKVLKQVRPDVIRSVRAAMKTDPRGASKGIRTAVYKKILGGNLNILDMRKSAGKTVSYEPPRKLRPHQRGGNRVVRGDRTNKIMHYGPMDRIWILRILNGGTKNGDRKAGTRGGKIGGKRGQITPRNFFGGAGNSALNKAAENLSALIDTELEKILNKKKK